MNIGRIYQIVFFLAFLLPVAVEGQISQGGIPIQINKQKSVSVTTDLVVMPVVDNLAMRNKFSRADENMLKPFRFAWSFDVTLSPNNSGKWYNTSEVNVWQLRIRSTGAYSLNLILNQFKLPEGARLFLISATTGDIKGAYTFENNTASKVLAIEPVSGDELLVQYEEPVRVAFRGEFVISKVAHDFIGITGDGVHRPLGISGSCNKNVNCDVANGDENIRDAVCRIIIEGTEICTGSMVNNTSLNGIPYLLTAYHCINTEVLAESSVFLFNYEMPYCSPNNPTTDGDINHSLSGGSLKASFDSLDFALLQLNNIPPYYYRPYLVGWNRINTPPSSSSCIHHPLGDLKKVSIDRLPAVTNTFNSSYKSKGFWNILRWDVGVTEQGSSGAPLFDQNKQLVGTLTGGSATCSSPTNDFFEKFALAWNYRPAANQQLKAWLDPSNSGVTKLSGMYINSGKTLCQPFTNLKDNDTHSATQITSGLTKKGYYGGSNQVGFTEFAEQYKFSKNCIIHGISLGIAKAKPNPLSTSSLIDVRVYSGVNLPATLLYSEKFDINRFYNDAMNYIPFQVPVHTEGNFFISYDISELQAGDSLVVYMANRKADVTNSFFLKNQVGWSTYNSQNLNGNGSALLTELNACDIDDPLFIDEVKTTSPDASFFPNPLYSNSLLNIKTNDSIDLKEDIEVFDLLGKKQQVQIILSDPNNAKLNFSGKRNGIYFIRLKAGGRSVVGKIAYIP